MNDKPAVAGDKQEIRDEKGRFIKGVSGNPEGKKPGTISVITKIKQYYEDNPEEFETLCKEFRDEKDYRKLLWSYLDGLPKASLDLGIDDDLKLAIEKINKTLP